MRRVVVIVCGMESVNFKYLGCCAVVAFSFIFQCRSSFVRFLLPEYIMMDSFGVSVTLLEINALQRPLFLCYSLLCYPNQPGWIPANPVALLFKFTTFRLSSAAYFHMTTSWAAKSAEAVIHRFFSLTGQVEQSWCHYGLHNPSICGFNAQFVLSSSRESILRRLDWCSYSMLRVYLDTTIVLTDHSLWLFAHVCTTARRSSTYYVFVCCT